MCRCLLVLPAGVRMSMPRARGISMLAGRLAATPASMHGWNSASIWSNTVLCRVTEIEAQRLEETREQREQFLAQVGRHNSELHGCESLCCQANVWAL